MSDSYFTELEELAAVVRNRAGEIEAGGDVPPDLMNDLCDLGVLQICTPRSSGGLERSPREWFRTVHLLARADASVGWVVSQPALYNAIVAVSGPAALQPMLTDRRFVIAASIAGTVVARRVENGYAVDGARWAFESGCTHATVIGGLIIVQGEEGDPPELRLAFAPADACTIERTWDALGLQGTASHDATIGPTVFPDAWSAPFPFEPITEDPIARMMLGSWPAACSCAAVQLGLASEALDVALQHAREKRRAGDTTTVFEQGTFHRAWSTAWARTDAALAGVGQALDQAWDQAVEGRNITVEQRSRLRLAAAHAVRESAAVVRACSEIVGADATYRRHRMERLFRDAHVLVHHVSVSDRAIESVSRVMHGLDADSGFV